MAAGATYEPIATQTLASAAAAITFSSIAATYTDLRIVFSGTVATAGSFGMQFNSDTASNYSRTFLYGTGSTAASGRSTSQTSIVGTNMGTTIPTLTEVDIFSYAGSTYKTTLIGGSADANGSGTTVRLVGLWRSTAAITTIKLFEANGANLSIGTTATLYGIKAA
jgi:hypothetical protein